MTPENLERHERIMAINDQLMEETMRLSCPSYWTDYVKVAAYFVMGVVIGAVLFSGG